MTRRWAWFASAAALLAALGLGLWLHRLELAGTLLARTLDRQGWGPAEFTLVALDLSGAEARDVSLRGGAIRLRALRLAYAPLDLLRRHVARGELTGLSLALATGDQGLTLG